MKAYLVLVILAWVALYGIVQLVRFARSPATQDRLSATTACMFAPEERAEWQQRMEKGVLFKDCYPVRLAEEREARLNRELLGEIVKTQQQATDTSR
jgi:hypothetical protein